MTGVVTKFDKRFGFIQADNGRSVFVHYSDIVGDGFRSLSVGDAVEFDVTESERGLKAINVKVCP